MAGQITAGKLVRAVVAAAGIAVLLCLLWFSRHVLLLAFAGMLIALIFTSVINQIRRLIPLRQGWGVALVLLLFLGVGALIGYLLAPGLISEFSALAQQIPKRVHELTENVQHTQIYQKVQAALPDLTTAVPASGGAFSKVGSVFSSTFDMLTGLVLVIFVALFLAANPPLYKRMLLRLFPPDKRDDAREVIARVICTLKFWLLGQLISMVLIGVLVGVAFGLCGLPLASSLGVLAGIGEFIPFVGPFVAVIPAMVLALSTSLRLFLIVLGVYLGIQFIEGHFLMPVVQRSTVDLPPVLTLLAIFFMGNAFGLLGMFVATPLTAVLLVLIEELYLRRYFGNRDEKLVQR